MPKRLKTYIDRLTAVEPAAQAVDGANLSASEHAMACQLPSGPIVVCDPDAPIEYGCRVLVSLEDSSGVIDGRCLTKHPRKAKTGIGVSFEREDGSPSELWGCRAKGPKRNVFRVVAEFPPIYSRAEAGRWRSITMADIVGVPRN